MGCVHSAVKEGEVQAPDQLQMESCEILTRFDESKQKQVIISQLEDIAKIEQAHNTYIFRTVDPSMISSFETVNFEEKMIILQPHGPHSVQMKKFFSNLSHIPFKNLFGIQIHISDKEAVTNSDEDLQEITKFLKLIAQTSDKLRFVSIKIPGWSHVTNKGLGRLLIGLKALLQKNKRVKFFELDFENINKAEDIIVENIANCIHQLADNNKCILHFSLNLNYWLNCTDEAVGYLMNSIIRLGGANTSLHYFYLNLSSWGLCTKEGLKQLGNALFCIADSNKYLTYFGLEMEEWWRCQDAEADALVSGFLKLTSSNSEIKKILLNFSSWGVGSAGPLKLLESTLNKILPKVEKTMIL